MKLHKITALVVAVAMVMMVVPAFGLIASADDTNLVTNGDFATGDTTGWTSRLGGEISGAEVVTDEEINANVLHMTSGAGGKNDPNTIGTAWTVETGKTYSFSFDIKLSSLISSNNYVYNKVTDKEGLADNGTSKDVAGNVLIDIGSSVTAANTWTHIEKTFTAVTDTVYFQLSWTSEAWIANVALTEVSTDFTTSVTINYLDRATETQIKDSVTVENLSGASDGSISYTVEDSAKETIDGYYYDTTSVESVALTDGENVINLYYIAIAAVSAESVTVDTNVNMGASLPSTVNVTYNDGSTKAADVTWEAVPALEAGKTYTVKGTADGVETNATINVFYGADKPADYDDYTWIGEGTQYPVAKDAANLVANPSFEEGLDGYYSIGEGGLVQAIGGGECTDEKAADGTYSYKQTTGGGGQSGNNLFAQFSLGDNVAEGKQYLLAFKRHGNGASSITLTVGLSATEYAEGATIPSDVVDESCGGLGNTGSSTVSCNLTGLPSDDWHQLVYALTANADSKYAVVYARWTEGQYFDDFELYELASDEVYEADAMQVKVELTVDGKTETSYVEKGSELPNYSCLYPCADISVEGDTSSPEVKVTVNTAVPAFESSIAIVDGNAVVYAVDEAVEGKLVVAQYAGDELVGVKTSDISVAVGESKEVALPATVENADAVRVMVLKDVNGTLEPVVKSAGATLGSYSPAVITVSDEEQASYANGHHTAAAMFDGDRATSWTSQKYTDNDHCWFILDFGKEITASELSIGYNSYEGRAAKLALSVSKDGKTYTEVYSGYAEQVDLYAISLAEAGSFRYIKYDGYGNNNTSDPKWTAINEIIIK